MKQKKLRNRIVGLVGSSAIILFFILFKFTNVTKYETVKLSKTDIIDKVSFSAQLYPNKISKIDLGTHDNIDKIMVKAGDSVRKGTLIAKLDSSDEESAYELAKKNYNSALYARNSSRGMSSILLTGVANSYKSILSFIDFVGSLDTTALPVSENELNDHLDKLRQDLKMQKGSMEKSIKSLDLGASAQTLVNTTYNQLKSAEKNLKKTNVKSPIEGTVLYVSSNDYSVNLGSSFGGTAGSSSLASISSFIGGGDIQSLFSSGGSIPTMFGSSEFNPTSGNFILIAEQSKWKLYPTFSEFDFAKIKSGQKVNLKIQAGSFQLESIVKSVIPVPTNLGKENPQYFAEIEVEDAGTNLFLGMSVKGEIVVNEVKGASVLPVEAILYDENDKPYVEVLVGRNKIVKRYVKLGVEGLTVVQVLEGLDTDDNVIRKESGKKLAVEFRF